MSTAGTLYDETIKNGYAKLLMTQTASNAAAIDFTLPYTEFDSFEFDLDCIKTTAADWFLICCSNDGGVSFPASADYWWAALTQWANVAPPALSHFSGELLGAPHTTFLLIAHATTVGHNMSGRVRLVMTPGTVSQFRWRISGTNPSNLHFTHAGAGMRYVAGLNAVRFFPYTGLISQGTIRMYGMRKG